jgi:hypothetical protein
MSRRTLTPAQALLARVARDFRVSPGSWSQGWGTRRDGTIVDSDPNRPTIMQMVTCCADIALKRRAPECGGEVVLQQARHLIYAHLQGKPCRETIWRFNDVEGRTVDEVVTLLEASAGLSVKTTSEPDLFAAQPMELALAA